MMDIRIEMKMVKEVMEAADLHTFNTILKTQCESTWSERGDLDEYLNATHNLIVEAFDNFAEDIKRWYRQDKP